MSWGLCWADVGDADLMKPFTLPIVILLIIASSMVCAGEVEKARPQRIVSLGLCTDQLLLMMVDRERIASLTYTAADPEMSYLASEVGDIPLNRGGFEEVIAFKPDLVVGNSYASWQTVRFLRELGYEVRLIELPASLADMDKVLLQFGEWVGESGRARQMMTNMDTQIAAIQSANAHKPQRSIMVYSPNGFTIGSGTLEDDIFRAAGYRNLAADMGIRGFRTISLEQLVAARPDFLQIDNRLENENSLASSYLNHPALLSAVPEQRRLYTPSRLRDCAGTMVVDAIDYLASRR